MREIAGVPVISHVNIICSTRYTWHEWLHFINKCNFSQWWWLDWYSSTSLIWPIIIIYYPRFKVRKINNNMTNHRSWRSPSHAIMIGWIYTCWQNESIMSCCVPCSTNRDCGLDFGNLSCYINVYNCPRLWRSVVQLFCTLINWRKSKYTHLESLLCLQV